MYYPKNGYGFVVVALTALGLIQSQLLTDEKCRNAFLYNCDDLAQNLTRISSSTSSSQLSGITPTMYETSSTESSSANFTVPFRI